MENYTNILIELFKGFGGFLASFVFVFGFAYFQLWKGAFWGRVTFSMVSPRNLSKNRFQLVMNTILDKPAIDVWINNRILLQKIRSSANRCTENIPWLRPQDDQLNYHIMSGIRQQISECFSEGILRHSIGKKTTENKFVYSLCVANSSRSKKVNIRKLRVFLIKPEILTDIRINIEKYRQHNENKLEIINILYKLSLKYESEKDLDEETQKSIYNVRIYT